MTDLSKANEFPLLKGSIDFLLLLPHYLDNIEDFIHLSSSCKTLHNIYAEHPPLPGLLFELAAASYLEIFEPKPHFLIAGVARQIGEWAIQTMLPYLQIAMFGGLFAASVRNFCEPGVTNPLHISIRLDWWVKCCPDLSCNDSWGIIDAQPSWMGDRQMYDMMKVLQITATLRTSTLISLMKQIPDCFATSAQNCKDISYDDTYHDRNFAFSAFIYL
ncbi:hypothetical protein BPAE_0120g00130 [Botrytis paeoniae]|uniref:F-box domain-containing protein n=1 Tax=Botrytis paeoniae TaxID=278948 RepID=A0A4Z1FG41_9HELO|nr:hypothetical protein BPAE_0120g00130 [Botrytis paeoniae]